MPFDAGAIRAYMTVDKSQFDKAGKEVQKSQKKMATQATKSGAAFKKMWKQLAVGLGVTGGIALAVRGLVRQFGTIIQKGREFEREWANVTTMLTVSETETESLRQQLRRLSPTLGDITDLAKGMYQVLSASIEPAKAIKFLGEAAKSAKAGVTDTKTAVDALTTVINAYGMAAEDVTNVSDIMFQTVKRGKVTYGELAHSLGTVVPIAATVGVEFKEIAAGVATMTRMGIDASKATMQLRQVLMSILTPSAEAEKLAEKLGITFGANALKTKGLAGWLTELREKTGGNVDAMKIFIPNARALTAVMALAGIRAQEYTKDLEGMEDVTGNTAEAMKKQMQTMDFWIKTIEVAADRVKVAFYEGLISQYRESIINAEDAEKKVTEATNKMADKVSMHASGMVEALTTVKKAYTIQFWPIKKLGELLANITQKGDDYETVVEKTRIALDRLAKSQATVTDVYAGAVEPASEAKEAVEETTGAVKEQVVFVDKLATGWELLAIQMRAVRDKFEPVKKSIIDTTEVLKQAAEAATSMSLRYEELGFVQEEKAKKTKEYTEFESMALATMQASYEGIVKTILSVIERWAIGVIVKKVMEALPFPANLLATAGAIGAVKAIFAGLKGMAEGGVVGLHGPEIVMVGEKGPEEIRPLRGKDAEGGSHSEFYTTVNIYPINLDRNAIRQAGEMMFAEIKYQERRRGH